MLIYTALKYLTISWQCLPIISKMNLQRQTVLMPNFKLIFRNMKIFQIWHVGFLNSSYCTLSIAKEMFEWSTVDLVIHVSFYT